MNRSLPRRDDAGRERRSGQQRRLNDPRISAESRGTATGGDGMEVTVERVAGLDVHKETVMAAVRTPGEQGRVQTVKEFRTFNAGLVALRRWLVEQGVTVPSDPHRARRSAGPSPPGYGLSDARTGGRRSS